MRINGKVVAIILAVLLLGGGAAYAGLQFFGGEDLPTVIYQDPDDPGPDPFTDPAIFLEDAQAAPDIDAGTTTTTIAGASPAPTASASPKGPFGGSGKKDECNIELLIQFLNQNPERKQAWVDVLGVNLADFETYVRGLTPTVLTRDTRVTNHGFKDGNAYEIQSILAAGTAVLVDAEGEIVTRCYCGNPLTPPDNIEYECSGCPPNYTPPPPCNRSCYPELSTTTTTFSSGSTTTFLDDGSTTTTRRRTTTTRPTTTRPTTTRPVTTVTTPPTTSSFPPAATTSTTRITTTPPTTVTTQPPTTTTAAATTTLAVTTTQAAN